jgi:hypothetical protein
MQTVCAFLRIIYTVSDSDHRFLHYIPAGPVTRQKLAWKQTVIVIRVCRQFRDADVEWATVA